MTGMTGKIDVHHHAILPRIAELMRRQGAPFTIPWSLGETERVMAEHGIEFAVVSNAIPGDFFDGVDAAAPFYRSANDAVAEFAAEHPGRFGLMSAIPMPYVDAALEEITYSYDVLKADGILLVPHAGTAYLGDPAYDPVLAELDRRCATVLVHPMALPGPSMSSVPYVLADFLLDTTRGAISMIMGEVLDRYPRISFVLAHGGGFLPYAATRVETLGDAFFGIDPARVREYIGRFFYDTALTGGSALLSLFDAVPPEQIVFGSDWCAAPRSGVAAATTAFDEIGGAIPDRYRELVGTTTALRLFPGVARRLRDVEMSGS